MIRTIDTDALTIAYEEHGPPAGDVTVLLHGFPYDPRSFDDVAPVLGARGQRVIVPYLRGYGPTRFRSPGTPRSGQQAALAHDLVDLLDALSIERAALMGYDWGGRAACIVAALWPQRVRGLVTGGGYLIQNIAAAARPVPPGAEHRLWYQYYLHSPRGMAGLETNRREFARLLWRQWSPTWHFDDAAFQRCAESFDNPDFVAIAVHSYRHRFGYAPGDPIFEPTERALAESPRIGVATLSLCGADDGVAPPPLEDDDAAYFSGHYERRVLPGVGHDIPREAPQATLAALEELR